MTAGSTGKALAARVHDGLDNRSRASDKALATGALLVLWMCLVLLALALLR